MVKADIFGLIDNLIKEEKIEKEMTGDLAEQIVADWINEDREKRGILTEQQKIHRVIENYYGKTDLAKQILQIQPLYYDENRVWWIWEKREFKWKVTDEINILNFVKKLSNYNTIKTKEKTEILLGIC